mmetsp:Transcript_32485/g.52621  ORF Transcript_32485/g.52621 Transcript_32485/m.52621 type:complete len:226 (+) Transcript_32485:82-759(+)
MATLFVAPFIRSEVLTQTRHTDIAQLRKNSHCSLRSADANRSRRAFCCRDVLNVSWSSQHSEDPCENSGSTRRSFINASALVFAAALSTKESQAVSTPPSISVAEWEDEGEWKTTISGLKYRDLVIGKTPYCKRNEIAFVNFVGYLDDGLPFDWNVERPYSFVVGQKKTIKAWDEAVLTMGIGGKRRLIVPPKIGWGTRGNPLVNVPEDATLFYDFELVDVQTFF